MQHTVVHPRELLNGEKITGRERGFAATIQWVFAARDAGVRVTVVLGELLDAVGIDFKCVDVGIDVLLAEMGVFLEFA